MKFYLSIVMLMLTAGGQSALAQVAQFPFEIKNNHMIIKAKMNQGDPLSFVFDTGATGTIIDSLAGEKSGISQNDRKKVEVNEYAGSKEYTMAVNQKINLAGKIDVDIAEIIMMKLDQPVAPGGNYDGIIGFDVLDKYTTRFDFEQHKISLYAGINAVDTTGYTGIPFEFSKGIMIPRFPISIQVDNGETFTGKVMFDSGAASTLFVSAPFKNFHNLSAKIGKTISVKGKGVNMETQDEKALIRSMSFKGFKFGTMVIGLSENDAAAPKDGYLGLIGLEIIRRFHVIIDYAHKKIYLKPNRFYNEPFNTILKDK